jgi:hypothetical protein
MPESVHRAEPLLLTMLLLAGQGCYKHTGDDDPLETEYTVSSEIDTATPRESDTPFPVDTQVESEFHTDTGTAPCCLIETIQWGMECAQNHMDPIFALGSCQNPLDSSSLYICDPTLAECDDPDLINPRDINPLLEQKDLLDAFVDTWIQYGTNVYPFYYIRLGPMGEDDYRQVFVGDPCPEDDPDCNPIPPSLQALKELLDTIVFNPESYPIGSLEAPVKGCDYHVM